MHCLVLLARTLDFCACLLLVYSPDDRPSNVVDVLQGVLRFVSLESYIRLRIFEVSFNLLALVAGTYALFWIAFGALLVFGKKVYDHPMGKALAFFFQMTCYVVSRAASTSFWVLACALLYCGESNYGLADCADRKSFFVMLTAGFAMVSHLLIIGLTLLFLNPHDPFSRQIFNGRSKLSLLTCELQFLVFGLYLAFLSATPTFRTHLLVVLAIISAGRAYLDITDTGFFLRSFDRVSRSFDGFLYLFCLWPFLNIHLSDSGVSGPSFINEVLASLMAGCLYAIFTQALVLDRLRPGSLTQEETEKSAQLLCVALLNLDDSACQDALAKFAFEHRRSCADPQCRCAAALSATEPREKLFDFVETYLQTKTLEFEESDKIYLRGIFLNMKKSTRSLRFVLNLGRFFKAKVGANSLALIFQRVDELETELLKHEFSERESVLFVLERYSSAVFGHKVIKIMQEFLIEYLIFLEEIAENSERLNKIFEKAMDLSAALIKILSIFKAEPGLRSDKRIVCLVCDFIRQLKFFPGLMVDYVDRILEELRKPLGLDSEVRYIDFQQSLVLVFSLNAANFSRITFASHSAPSFLNYTVEQLESKQLEEIMPAQLGLKHGEIILNYLEGPTDLRRNFQTNQIFMVDSEGLLVSSVLRGKILPYLSMEARMVGSIALKELPRHKGVILFNSRGHVLGINYYVESTLELHRSVTRADKTAEILIEDLIPGFVLSETSRDRPQQGYFNILREFQKKNVSIEFSEHEDAPLSAQKEVSYLLGPSFRFYKDINVLFVGLCSQEQEEIAEEELNLRNFQRIANSQTTIAGLWPNDTPLEIPNDLLSSDREAQKGISKPIAYFDKGRSENTLKQYLSNSQFRSSMLSFSQFLISCNFIVSVLFLILIYLIIAQITKNAMVFLRFIGQIDSIRPLHDSLTSMTTTGFKIMSYPRFDLDYDREQLLQQHQEAINLSESTLSVLPSVIELYSKLFDDSLRYINRSERCPYDTRAVDFVIQILGAQKLIKEGSVAGFDFKMVQSTSGCLLQVRSSGIFLPLRRCHRKDHEQDHRRSDRRASLYDHHRSHVLRDPNPNANHPSDHPDESEVLRSEVLFVLLQERDLSADRKRSKVLRRDFRTIHLRKDRARDELAAPGAEDAARRSPSRSKLEPGGQEPLQAALDDPRKEKLLPSRAIRCQVLRADHRRNRVHFHHFCVLLLRARELRGDLQQGGLAQHYRASGTDN